MVFKRESHELVLQKQFMQLIKTNPKIKNLVLYIMDPQYLAFQLIKKI